jgi:hypothetical protein
MSQPASQSESSTVARSGLGVIDANSAVGRTPCSLARTSRDAPDLGDLLVLRPSAKSSMWQAVEEMRREVSALFAEQRRDIELQQMRPMPSDQPTASIRVSQFRTRSIPRLQPNSRQLRMDVRSAHREMQAANTKATQKQQRNEALTRIGQEGERRNGRDGAER